MATGIIYPATPVVNPNGQTYNDGGSVYGAAQLTFNGTAVYDTDAFDPVYASSRKEQTNRYNVPVRAFATPTVPNGSCNVQIPASNSYMPKPGDTFTADLFSAASWFVDSVGTPFKKDDYLILAVNYHMKLN